VSLLDFVSVQDLHRQQSYSKLLFQTFPTLVACLYFITQQVEPDSAFPYANSNFSSSFANVGSQLDVSTWLVLVLVSLVSAALHLVTELLLFALERSLAAEQTASSFVDAVLHTLSSRSWFFGLRLFSERREAPLTTNRSLETQPPPPAAGTDFVLEAPAIQDEQASSPSQSSVTGSISTTLPPVYTQPSAMQEQHNMFATKQAAAFQTCTVSRAEGDLSSKVHSICSVHRLRQLHDDDTAPQIAESLCYFPTTSSGDGEKPVSFSAVHILSRGLGGDSKFESGCVVQGLRAVS